MDWLKELLFGDYKFYLAFALFGSLVLVVQLIMSMFGMDGDHDVDGDGSVEFGEHADTGLGDFRFFSLRSIFAFITFFGWGGVIAYKYGITGMPCLLIAAGCGVMMMFLTALLLFGLLKMQHSGNIEPGDIIGSLGTVYLRIPGGRTEIGKVTAEVKGTSQEIIAVADEEIPRGSSVRVVKLVDSRRFLVEKIQT